MTSYQWACCCAAHRNKVAFWSRSFGELGGDLNDGFWGIERCAAYFPDAQIEAVNMVHGETPTSLGAELDTYTVIWLHDCAGSVPEAQAERVKQWLEGDPFRRLVIGGFYDNTGRIAANAFATYLGMGAQFSTTLQMAADYYDLCPIASGHYLADGCAGVANSLYKEIVGGGPDNPDWFGLVNFGRDYGDTRCWVVVEDRETALGAYLGGSRVMIGDDEFLRVWAEYPDPVFWYDNEHETDPPTRNFRFLLNLLTAFRAPGSI